MMCQHTHTHTHPVDEIMIQLRSLLFAHVFKEPLKHNHLV